MDVIPEYEFKVDEQYENEKGVFTVVSMDKIEMVIRWENGEEIRTPIQLQRQIQERRFWEKQAREKAKAASAKKMRQSAAGASHEFEGLAPTDFKNTAAKTHWRGRKQLGGAVTKHLPTDSFIFNSWAFAHNPELHWAVAQRRKADIAVFQSKFFVKLDDRCLTCGFHLRRPEADQEACKDWDSFSAWLARENNEHFLETLVDENQLAVLDGSGTRFIPTSKGWQLEADNDQKPIQGLLAHIDSQSGGAAIELSIVRKIPKDEAVELGKNVASHIANLFIELMPLYSAAVE